MGKVKEKDIKEKEKIEELGIALQRQQQDTQTPDRDHECMALWDNVSKTDIDHTKEVSFGRKFTAIDAHSQIMEATRQFGPAGEGWGYDNLYGQISLPDQRVIAWCDVKFWWRDTNTWEGHQYNSDKKYFGPVRGAAMLVSIDTKGKAKNPDTDAYKKASTDGLTKLLSHLGFNADVFLGQFDDNKYVQELKKEKSQEQTAKQNAYEQDRAKFIEAISKCSMPEHMDSVLENHKLWMAGLPVSTATEMRAWVVKQQTELSEKERQQISQAASDAELNAMSGA